MFLYNCHICICGVLAYIFQIPDLCVFLLLPKIVYTGEVSTIQQDDQRHTVSMYKMACKQRKMLFSFCIQDMKKMYVLTVLHEPCMLPESSSMILSPGKVYISESGTSSEVLFEEKVHIPSLSFCESLFSSLNSKIG